MTKEEIINKIIPRNCFWEESLDNVPLHYIHTAMDEYAKQMCIQFGGWVYVYGYRHSYTTANWYHDTDHTQTYTTDELYTEFIKQYNQ